MNENEPQQKPMPDTQVCATYEEFQALTSQWDQEGFQMDKNIPKGEAPQIVASYQRDPDIEEVRLSTAFTLPAPENEYKGALLEDHVCAWFKKKEGRE